MTKRNKLIQRLRNNNKNVSFNELDNLLIGFGFEKTSKGSHFVYKKPGCRPLTLPYRTPFVLPVYVNQVLKLIDELGKVELD